MALLLCSCGVTRGLSDGEYLLTNVGIDVIDSDSLARNEKVSSVELYKYVKQRPNKRFLGINFYAWVYSLANPQSSSWLNRMARRIGEEPIIYDSVMSSRSVRDMDLYMYGSGFLQANSSFEVDTVRKKAKVTYLAKHSTPYRIGKLEYVFNDESIAPIILGDTTNSMAKVGDIFDINVLDRERGRVAKYLNNKGYYNFQVTNLSYVADSSVGDRRVDLKMIVNRNLVGYNDSGQAILEDNKVYRINNVYVLPDFQPMTMAGDNTTLATALSDTVRYQGLTIIANDEGSCRPKVLRDLIGIHNNDKYDASKIQESYDELIRLGYFKSVSIVFTDVSDSTDMDQGLLNCNIVCTPGKRQSYSIDLEGTTTSDYYGITATLGYQNRNIFGGFELFDISLSGGYEFLSSSSSSSTDSFLFGVNTSFTFPRFIQPFGIGLDNLRNTTTRLEFSYEVQRRPYYHRTLSSAVFGYQWSAYRHESYVLRPIDISVVKLKYIDENYLESLDNPYLVNSYESQIIGGISGSYIYNNSENNSNLNFTKWRVNLETNGNLISAVTSVFNNEYTSEDGESYDRIFGVRYAQYVRGDVEFSKSFKLSRESSLVYRFYTGAGLAYGNSSTVPYEKLFYCGGSNSMRGWQARTLGPGSTAEPTDVVYDSQLGNFKLETNLEARFPVWGMFKGAVFCDVGNVWFLKSEDYSEEGVFKFDTFFSQLGFDAGIGLRMDFNFFVFRVDWGLKIHNPNKSVGNRWIQGFSFSDTTLNFGVGYPF